MLRTTSFPPSPPTSARVEMAASAGGGTSLSLKFAFGFALSLSLSLSLSFFLPSASHHHLPLRPKLAAFRAPPCRDHPRPRKRVAADLLALLGGPRDAAAVDPAEARQLRSCLRFLVPSDPPPLSLHGEPQRRALGGIAGGGKDEEEEEEEEEEMMVWWPPRAVMDLARVAVDSGGDVEAVQRGLDPTMLEVPDVEGCRDDKCQLTRTPYGRRFVCKELNSYFGFLFELIVSRGPSVGLNVSLSRYDLFHGHIFLATESGRLGILFHAKEYPAYEKKIFPINMGYCQTGSDVEYGDSINLRNILWLAPLPSNETSAWLAPGALVVLDAHPDGIIYKDLVPEYVDVVRTIYEEDFGEDVGDINYLNVSDLASGERIFIC